MEHNPCKDKKNYMYEKYNINLINKQKKSKSYKSNKMK